MLVDIIKNIWKYTTYNKPFLLIILFLFFVFCLLMQIFDEMRSTYALLLSMIPYIFISGYGMIITKDVMNNGKRLPKIFFKDVVVLGIKSTVVATVYFYVQLIIFVFISSLFGFPAIDFEDLVFDFLETVPLLFNHDLVATVIFLGVGFLVFYFIAFFMEMALAKLADTGSILEAFHLRNIKKTIDVIGWGLYAKHYTVIILLLGVFSLLINIDVPFFVFDYIFKVFLILLLFITQYWGIGALYGIFKRKQSNDLD